MRTAVRQRGFTLIEVVVALAILALTAAAASRQGAQILMELGRMERQTQALWLIENEIARLRLHEPWPALGRRSRRVEAMQEQWNLTIAVSATPNADMRRIDVSAAVNSEPTPILTLTTYGGRY